MSVKECRRNGCAEIMCETYIEGIGYIGGGCSQEFIESFSKLEAPKSEIDEAMRKFIDSEKEDNEVISLQDYFGWKSCHEL